MSAISRTSREVSATLLANASEDIEKKRHRRNPFGQQYIQLLQTPLEEDEEADLQPDDAKEAIDSATASIHVRIELLKTMKQALLKQTADEVKQFRPDRATPTKLAHKPDYRPQREDNATENADISKETFFNESAIKLYQDNLEGRNIDINEKEFSASLAGNPHTRAEIEISYDVSGLAPETFEQLEERLFPKHRTPQREMIWVPQESRHISRVEEELLQSIALCVSQLRLSNKVQAAVETATEGRRSAKITCLPSYLQQSTQARLQMDDDIQTGEDNTNYSQTDDVKAPDVSTSQKHARLPDHLHYEDTHGAQNIVFPPEDPSIPASLNSDLPEDLPEDAFEGQIMGAEHHLPLPGDDADMVDEERCIGPEQVEGLPRKLAVAPVLANRCPRAAAAAAAALPALPVHDKGQDAALEIIVDADESGPEPDEPVKALDSVPDVPARKALARPCLQKRVVLQLAESQTEKDAAGAGAEDIIEDTLEGSVAGAEDDREALANVTLEPDFSLEHLVSVHAATSLGHPKGKKAAYRPVSDPKVLLVPRPAHDADLHQRSALTPRQLMQVFKSSLQQPDQPWAAIEERVVQEQHSAQAAQWSQQPDQPCCVEDPLSSMQHGLPAAPASRASTARLLDISGLGRPATAKELISGLQLNEREGHHSQLEGVPLEADKAYAAHIIQPVIDPYRVQPSALGVFADCSSGEDDDKEVLQAAIDAEAQLRIQHGPLDIAEEGLLAADTYPMDTIQLFDSDNEHEAARYADTHAVPWQQAHLSEAKAGAWQDQAQQDTAGIVFECSDLKAGHSASQQPEGIAKPDAGVYTLSMQTNNMPGRAGRPQLQTEGFPYAESPVNSGWPLLESEEFVFCDDQGMSCQPLHGTAGVDKLWTLRSADNAQQNIKAQRVRAQEPNASLASQHLAKGQIALRNFCDEAASATEARDDDYDLEDIQIVTDAPDDKSRDEEMSCKVFRDVAARDCEPADAFTLTDSKTSYMPADDPLEQAEEQSDDNAVQAGWNEEEEGSEGIIFDDTAVDLAVQWMQGDSACQLEDFYSDPMGQIHSSSAAAQARQKRARENLRDKLIQELLEDGGRISKLEPLIAYMRDQLAEITPDMTGLYPTSLLKLHQGSISAQVPGSEASKQRHLYGLLTFVQRCNMGTAGANALPMEGKWQLKLESVHNSQDVLIRRIPGV